MIDANKTLRSIIGSLNYDYHKLEESCPELLEECKKTLKEYTELLLKEAADKAEIKERKISYSSSSGSEYCYVQYINKQSITSIINDINFD